MVTDFRRFDVQLTLASKAWSDSLPGFASTIPRIGDHKLQTLSTSNTNTNYAKMSSFE